MESTTKLYTLSYREIKTYWMALLFVAGNIFLPQLCHLLPHGGAIWLPIYFFTLVGAYKYGWRVGLLVALASPLVNSMLFDMPAQDMLPVIFMKSILLATVAGWMAQHSRTVSLLSLLSVVLSYQLFGTLGEWALRGNLYMAFQDLRMGLPGMMLQWLGGYALLHVFKD